MNGRPGRSSSRARTEWRKDAETVAWLAAKASGCECQPSVDVRARPHVEMRHDGDCRMADYGQQVVTWGGRT